MAISWVWETLPYLKKSLIHVCSWQQRFVKVWLEQRRFLMTVEEELLGTEKVTKEFLNWRTASFSGQETFNTIATLPRSSQQAEHETATVTWNPKLSSRKLKATLAVSQWALFTLQRNRLHKCFATWDVLLDKSTTYKYSRALLCNFECWRVCAK